MNSATSPLEPQAAHPHIVDDLKFGRKYYFLVETQLANPPYIAPSRASDPLEIQCPAFACCDRGPSCPLEMPEGATVAELVPQQGAYRVSNVTFAPCLNAGACLNSGCGEGYDGLLCHRCIPGYARSGMHDCRPCDAGNVAFITLGILVSICICVYFIRSTLESSEKTMEIEMFKIGLSGMQALTVLGRYPLQWPAAISTIFDAMGTAFSAAGEVVSFQCAMDDANGSRYLRGAAVVLGTPLLVTFVVGIFGGIHFLRRKDWKKSRSNFVVSIMVILFLVLPTLNQTTFRLFTCTRITDTISRVSGDLEVPCYEAIHLAYVFGVAVPSLLVYALGIPSLAVFLLYRMKKKQKLFQSRDISYTASVYQFLYGGYRLEAYYWEAIIMFRKVSLNLVLVVMAPSPPLAQALTVLYVLLLFLAFHVKKKPYSNDKLNFIEMYSLMLATAILAAGMYLFNDEVRRDVGVHITIAMVAALLISLVGFIYFLYQFARAEHAEEVEGALAKAKIKASHGLHILQEKVHAGIEMVSTRMWSLSGAPQETVPEHTSVNMVDNPISRAVIA